jgi:hypothetical protein
MALYKALLPWLTLAAVSCAPAPALADVASDLYTRKLPWAKYLPNWGEAPASVAWDEQTRTAYSVRVVSYKDYLKINDNKGEIWAYSTKEHCVVFKRHNLKTYHVQDMYIASDDKNVAHTQLITTRVSEDMCGSNTKVL